MWLSPFECVRVFIANCPVDTDCSGKYRRERFRGLCHHEQETCTKPNKVQGWRWPRSKKWCHWVVRAWPTFIWMPTNLYKLVWSNSKTVSSFLKKLLFIKSANRDSTDEWIIHRVHILIHEQSCSISIDWSKSIFLNYTLNINNVRQMIYKYSTNNYNVPLLNILMFNLFSMLYSGYASWPSRM